jgi:hypothetical protein
LTRGRDALLAEVREIRLLQLQVRLNKPKLLESTDALVVDLVGALEADTADCLEEVEDLELF